LSSAAVLMRAVISLTKDQPELLVKPVSQTAGARETVDRRKFDFNS
jgi:hypothetical protein